MSKSKSRLLITDNSEMFRSDVLSWSDAADIWWDHKLGDKYSLEQDVLPYCNAIDVEREEYDHGVPGRSGVRHIVSTTDPEEAREQFLARIAVLCEPASPKVATSPSKRGPFSSLDDLERELLGMTHRASERVGVGPGHWKGLGNVDATRLRTIAQEVMKSASLADALSVLLSKEFSFVTSSSRLDFSDLLELARRQSAPNS